MTTLSDLDPGQPSWCFPNRLLLAELAEAYLDRSSPVFGYHDGRFSHLVSLGLAENVEVDDARGDWYRLTLAGREFVAANGLTD